MRSWMSSSVLRLLLTVLPRYVNSSISSTYSPSMNTPLLRLAQIRIIFVFVFVALIVKPTFAPCSFKVCVLSPISYTLCDSRTRSPAKSTSCKDVVKDHWIPRLLAKAVPATQSRATRNSKGDSRQPCLTLVLVFSGSVFCPLCTTCAEKPS